MIAPRLRILIVNYNRLFRQALNVVFPPIKIVIKPKKNAADFKQKNIGPTAE